MSGVTVTVMSGDAPDERPQRRREYSGAGSTLGLALLVVVTVGVAIWYFELRGTDAGGGGRDDGYGIIALPEGANPTGEDPAAQEGRAAPGFRLANLGGQPVDLVEFRGNYVLLNFWARWCPPCRAEIPDLQRFYEEAQADGWVVVGVNQQDLPGDAAEFLEPFGVTYPQVLDRDGEVSVGYRVGRGLPVTFVLDPEGVIQRVVVGALSSEQLAELKTEFGG